MYRTDIEASDDVLKTAPGQAMTVLILENEPGLNSALSENSSPVSCSALIYRSVSVTALIPVLWVRGHAVFLSSRLRSGTGHVFSLMNPQKILQEAAEHRSMQSSQQSFNVFSICAGFTFTDNSEARAKIITQSAKIHWDPSFLKRL